MDLRAKIEEYKYQQTLASLQDVLIACIDVGDQTGLNCVLELLSFQPEYTQGKLPHRLACIITTLYWEKQGLTYLVKFAFSSERVTLLTHILETLSHAAANTLDFLAEMRLKMFGNQFDNLLEKLDFRNEKYHSDDFIFVAKEELINFVLHYENESVLYTFSHALNLMTFGEDSKVERAFSHLLAAISNRWLRVSREGLDDYYNIIQKPDISEEDVHKYIAKNPYLLDPFYAHVWSKVSLGEKLIADFVVRLMDDSYIVIEIEKPNDPILNKMGDLSSKTTHATDQMIQYRDWLIYNHLYANQQFEHIRKPSGLVVIGMENRCHAESCVATSYETRLL